MRPRGAGSNGCRDPRLKLSQTGIGQLTSCPHQTSENLFASAELCKFNFVARGVLEESDRGNLVPDGDRSHGGEVEIARFERRRELSGDQPGNAVHV